jgi:hypothetical protein
VSPLALIPADAMAGWDTGAGLKTGDTVCGPRFQTTSGRMYGSIVNGAGTATIRVASTVGGPETVVFSQTGTNLNVNKTVTAPPGSYMRGCIQITAHTINTWSKVSLFASGTVSPGQPVRGGFAVAGRAVLRGQRDRDRTAARIRERTWALNGIDNDYAFVGTVFSVTGSSVDTTYTSGPDLADLEMCVVNTSQQTVTATFDLVMK